LIGPRATWRIVCPLGPVSLLVRTLCARDVRLLCGQFDMGVALLE
jgi:hypothetical protein